MKTKRDDEVIEMFRRCIIADEFPCFECPYKGKDVCFKELDRDVYEILEKYRSKADDIYQIPLPGLEV